MVLSDTEFQGEKNQNSKTEKATVEELNMQGVLRVAESEDQ